MAQRSIPTLADLDDVMNAVDRYELGDHEFLETSLVLTPGSIGLRVRTTMAKLTPLPPREGIVRGPTTGWSRWSRARAVRRWASLDYSSLFADPDAVPLLLTLTYPSDWERWAPDPATVQGHLTAWRVRLGRALQATRLAPAARLFDWLAQLSSASDRSCSLPRTVSLPPGLWKEEFQARGAPHFHVLVSIPATLMVRHMTLDALPEVRWVWRLETREDWCARTWAQVVGCDDPEFVRHGAYIDPRYVSTDRLSDPARVAIYMTAHALPGEHKDYQHRPPSVPGWEGKSWRLWGYWGLRPAEVQEVVNPLVGQEVRRILRAHVEAQGTLERDRCPHCKHRHRIRPRCRRVRVQRVNRKTGEIYYRWVTRRVRLRAAYGSQGCTRVTVNAPRVADCLIDAATYAATAKVVPDPTWWHSPGEPRCPEVFR